jgi:hypothetical protein
LELIFIGRKVSRKKGEAVWRSPSRERLQIVLLVNLSEAKDPSAWAQAVAVIDVEPACRLDFATL